MLWVYASAVSKLSVQVDTVSVHTTAADMLWEYALAASNLSVHTMMEAAAHLGPRSESFHLGWNTSDTSGQCEADHTAAVVEKSIEMKPFGMTQPPAEGDL